MCEALWLSSLPDPESHATGARIGVIRSIPAGRGMRPFTAMVRMALSSGSPGICRTSLVMTNGEISPMVLKKPKNRAGHPVLLFRTMLLILPEWFLLDRVPEISLLRVSVHQNAQRVHRTCGKRIPLSILCRETPEIQGTRFGVEELSGSLAEFVFQRKGFEYRSPV